MNAFRPVPNTDLVSSGISSRPVTRRDSILDLAISSYEFSKKLVELAKNLRTIEQTKNMDIRGIAIVLINVSDMERSVSWYCEHLGFRRAADQMLQPGVLLQVGGDQIYLTEVKSPVPEFGGGVEICLTVPSVRAAFDELLANGLVVDADLHVMNEHFARCTVTDPDQNRLQLWGSP
jgi:catechol 2,3-dioxygenase-like lactoylglutathione lyase family enzyme